MVEHERTGPLDRVTWGFSRIAMWAPAFIVALAGAVMLARMDEA